MRLGIMPSYRFFCSLKFQGVYDRGLTLTLGKCFQTIETYITCQNKRNNMKPLDSGHLRTTDTERWSLAVSYMEVPL